MQSIVALAFVGAAVAQKGYPAPPSYGESSSSPAPPTSSCPAPGSEDAQGRYSCNPAHAYPTGQTCVSIDGCYFLEYPASSSSYGYSTTSVVSPYQTPSCPAPGTTDDKGRYSCNPAHSYPAGQTCESTDGCYFLEYPASSSSYGHTTSSVVPPAHPTPSCPAPGTTDDKGRYSCNPAHAYPAGQTCKSVEGCYFLEYPEKTASHPAPVYPVSTKTDSSPVHPTTYAPSETHSVPIYKNTTIVQPPHYTTEVHTAYTTYCPEPTTFTHGATTYTVTKATTITLPCEHGCTVTKSIPANTQTKVLTETHSVPHYSTVVVSQPPVTETTVATAYTTYCPEPTTITHKQSTYVITTATTLTLPCPGGCVVTKEIPQPPKTTVITATVSLIPTPVPNKPEQPKTSTQVVTHPAPVPSSYAAPPPNNPASPVAPPPSHPEAPVAPPPSHPEAPVAPPPSHPEAPVAPQPYNPVSPVAPAPSNYAAPPPSHPESPVAPPSHPEAPVVPAYSPPTYTARVNTSAPVSPVPTASTPAVYTGSASKHTAGAMLAFAGIAAFFL